MSQPLSLSHKLHQRGAAALVVSLVLLFGMTIVAFFANRGMIFEQRTSANQYRSTIAFEMAEAGLEWAVARLNDDQWLATAPSCTPSVGGTARFADRYLPMTAAGFTVTTAKPGCSISSSDGTLSCGCPSAGNATLGTSADRRFLVEFAAVPSDPWAVEIRSYGCTNEGTACDPASTARPDGIAVVSALYKMKPAIPNAPAAGLVTGSAAVTGGSLNVINLDAASNGITINSGTTVDLGTGTSVVTLPGTPPRASVLDNDPSLNALTTADDTGDIFFASFFGETMSQYQDNQRTYLITIGSCGDNTRCSSCSGKLECGSAISAAYDKGYQKFWADTDVAFGSSNLPAAGTLGTGTRPITIAGAGAVELKASITAYGMFYAATATVDDSWDYSGSGTAKVYGAFISRGSFNKGSGTLDLIYDANIFKPEYDRNVMVRVPGSWRDMATFY